MSRSPSTKHLLRNESRENSIDSKDPSVADFGHKATNESSPLNESKILKKPTNSEYKLKSRMSLPPKMSNSRIIQNRYRQGERERPENDEFISVISGDDSLENHRSGSKRSLVKSKSKIYKREPRPELDSVSRRLYETIKPDQLNSSKERIRKKTDELSKERKDQYPKPLQ